MHVSLQENILWASAFLGHVFLFIVLLLRDRRRQFPVFTTLIGFYILRTIVLFMLFRQQAFTVYTSVYWSAAAIDVLLQLALIIEIARIVLRPTGTWVRDARASFITLGVVGALVAFGLSYAVKPSTGTSLNDWMVRASLFTSLLFCELFLAMLFASHRLGLVWRNHVMGLGQGFTLWALVSTLVDTAHSYFPPDSYFGTHHHFVLLEQIRIYVYLVALLYWIVTLWINEPERRPISEEMQKYLVALHAKVQYDSSQVSSVQNLR